MASSVSREQQTRPHHRSTLRGVTVPTEHGGWGLTSEPVLLGLLVAPSVAGVCLGLAAIVAFLAHTPLRVILVDRHRHRDLDRTVMARLVLGAELAVLAALVTAAALTATAAFWWPAGIAAPLVAVELWFDTRSRSRRLLPELAGTFGIGSVAAMILLAAGHLPSEATAVWLILAARATTSITHVRAQIARLHGRPTSAQLLLATDVAALVIAALAVAVTPGVIAGAVSVAAVVVFQRVTTRTPAPAKVVGIRQSVLGLVVCVATATGLRLA
ncbi:MAG TPA: YwiC-like family protein [Acidimicrobiales bacterium]